MSDWSNFSKLRSRRRAIFPSRHSHQTPNTAPLITDIAKIKSNERFRLVAVFAAGIEIYRTKLLIKGCWKEASWLQELKCHSAGCDTLFGINLPWQVEGYFSFNCPAKPCFSTSKIEHFVIQYIFFFKSFMDFINDTAYVNYAYSR